MNSYDIPNDQMADLEEGMRHALSAIGTRQWFTVDRLAELMDGGTKEESNETLDAVIAAKLKDWNWYRSDRGWGGPSFVRRERETAAKMIRPIGGRMFGTRASWPPYGNPDLPYERPTRSQTVRQRFNSR